ncbi:unnamed protein product [Rangifer tarandus platyrhynchus]|uniref:Uncharacterized protein n=2 Tax=Rangifer tarandus platyrhynchus TaxID=3082113 RepID=A0ABN8ZZW1_RANTA|nr:unnamed protein product [Rangifer tarandus platyrhynchus]
MSSCLGGGIKVMSKEGGAAKDGLQIENNCPGSSRSARRVSYSSRDQRHHKQLRATVKMEVDIPGLRRSQSRAHKWGPLLFLLLIKIHTTEDLNRPFSKDGIQNGQQAREKMLNITSHQRNANQNYIDCHLTLVRMPFSKSTNNKC